MVTTAWGAACMTNLGRLRWQELEVEADEAGKERRTLYSVLCTLQCVCPSSPSYLCIQDALGHQDHESLHGS